MTCYHCGAEVDNTELHDCLVDNPYWEERTSPYCEECGLTKNGQGTDRCRCNDPPAIMNPGIKTDTTHWGKEPDRNWLRRFFGGQ